MAWKILRLRDAEELRGVRRNDFAGERITAEEFDHMLRLCNGLWLHNGDPSAPHAELTAGGCSNGFVNTLRLLKYANICTLLGEDLAWIYRRNSLEGIDWVVGSDHAGATISFAVAHHLGAKHEFTEKGPEGKSQLWKRETIAPHEIVQQVEELVTTTSTLEKVRRGIVEGNANPVTFASAVLTLVHRSPSYEFEGSPILYFRHYDIESWKAEDCPLCAVGSKKLRPKQHWTELTAA